MFEGDIIKTTKLNDVVKEMKHLVGHGMKAFDAINGGAWPEAKVPYTFSRYFSSSKSLLHLPLFPFPSCDH